jgi:large conductance mechanosensitive channel
MWYYSGLFGIIAMCKNTPKGETKMKKFMSEFRDFALKGNVMDLAVAVIIGAAFQAIVGSLTEQILSPIIGLFVGSNFDALTLEVLGVSIGYGAFITSIINFVIMAFVVFILVRAINRISAARAKETVPAEPTTKKCPFCFIEIDIQATRCPACTSQLED